MPTMHKNLPYRQLHSRFFQTFHARRRKVLINVRRSQRKGRHYQPRFSPLQIALAWIGSFLGIWLLASLSFGSPYPLIAAPMGATSVLVFGVPQSPLAQPRNVLGGNLIAAAIAILLVRSFGISPWVMAGAVSTSIVAMKLTRTVHPPSGAVALVGVMSDASWNFVLAPVLAGSLAILIWAWLFNNLGKNRTYPSHWL